MRKQNRVIRENGVEEREEKKPTNFRSRRIDSVGERFFLFADRIFSGQQSAGISRCHREIPRPRPANQSRRDGIDIVRRW